MKKVLITCLVTLSIMGTPVKSDAAVTLAMGLPQLAVLLSLATGDLIQNAGYVWALVFGGVILDKGTNELKFTPVEEKLAASKGVSKVELAAYNAEIDQVNLAMQEAVLKTTKEGVIETISQSLSTDAYSAFSKMFIAK